MTVEKRSAFSLAVATIFWRSLVFNGALYLLTTVVCIFGVWTLLLPRSYLLRVVHLWERGVSSLERHVLGLQYEIVGREHLPEGACIVAAKHQSIWGDPKTASAFHRSRDCREKGASEHSSRR